VSSSSVPTRSLLSRATTMSSLGKSLRRSTSCAARASSTWASSPRKSKPGSRSRIASEATSRCPGPDRRGVSREYPLIKERRMQRKFHAGVVLAVALVSVAAAGCDKLKARDLLNKGVNAYKGAQFDVAIEDFKQAKELDPTLMNAQI